MINFINFVNESLDQFYPYQKTDMLLPPYVVEQYEFDVNSMKFVIRFNKTNRPGSHGTWNVQLGRLVSKKVSTKLFGITNFRKFFATTIAILNEVYDNPDKLKIVKGIALRMTADDFDTYLPLISRAIKLKLRGKFVMLKDKYDDYLNENDTKCIYIYRHGLSPENVFDNVNFNSMLSQSVDNTEQNPIQYTQLKQTPNSIHGDYIMRHEAVIPTHNLPLLATAVEKMNKRANKYGLASVKMEIKEEFSRKVKAPANFMGTQFVDLLMSFTRVSIEGETPIINGWKIIGRIDHTQGINIFHSSGGETISSKFERVPHCDHCNTKKIKAKSYIIYNGIEQKQIGSGCMTHFFDKSVEEYLNYMAWFDAIKDQLKTFGDIESTATNNDYGYSPEDVIAVASAVITHGGFKPSSEVGSTKELVINSLYGKGGFKADDNDKELSRKVIQYFKDNDFEDEFNKNLKKLLNLSVIPYKYIGHVVASIPVYNKAIKPKAEKKVSEYVGSIGDKITVKVKLKFKTAIDGYYGTTLLHNFEDENGNIFVWFGNKSIGVVDDQYDILTATIKDHREYQDVKQTVITRAKIK
jgi:hypothetical protein